MEREERIVLGQENSRPVQSHKRELNRIVLIVAPFVIFALAATCGKAQEVTPSPTTTPSDSPTPEATSSPTATIDPAFKCTQEIRIPDPDHPGYLDNQFSVTLKKGADSSALDKDLEENGACIARGIVLDGIEYVLVQFDPPRGEDLLKDFEENPAVEKAQPEGIQSGQ